MQKPVIPSSTPPKGLGLFEFGFDMTLLSQVPNDLYSLINHYFYYRTARLKHQFSCLSTPRDLAVDENGFIYVSYTTKARGGICMFTPEGELLKSWGENKGMKRGWRPNTFFVTPSGDLVMNNDVQGEDGLQIYDPTTGQRRTIAPKVFDPTKLIIDSAGAVAALEVQWDTWKISVLTLRSGKLLKQVEGTADPPFSVAKDNQGRYLFCCLTKILRCDPTGRNFETLIEDQGLKEAIAMVFDPTRGQIVVLDKKLKKIQVHSEEGEFLLNFDTQRKGKGLPLRVVVNKEGEYIVLEEKSNLVKIFEFVK